NLKHYHTDGKDKYIIKNSEGYLPEESNQNTAMSMMAYGLNNLNQENKTTIHFGLKGGQDEVIDGLYLKEELYGDIIVINEPSLTMQDIAFSKTNDYVKAILSDGSSITLNITGNEDPEAVFFKVNNQLVTNTDLDIYSLPEI